MRFAGLARRVVAVSCAVLAGLACSCGAASAALTHNFVSSFGSFASVQGIAVDQTSGNVYVYDAGAGSVLKFDASGQPANFASTGTNAIGGVGGAGEAEDEIAVDNSTSPAKGDIYVANGGHIGIYSTSGEALGELAAETGKPWGEPCGVAVDASGTVYVGLWNGGPGYSYVNRYVPTSNPAVGRDYVSSLTGVSEVCNVTAGNEGSIYTDSWPEGPIEKYEALQFSAGAGMEVAGGGRALTVDPTTNDLYVARYGEVAQFEPSGALLDTFAGAEADAFGNAHGIAVNGTSGDVYVSDNEHGRVEVFGPGVTVADVATGQPTSVSPTDATLTGTVNPDGMEVTACQFEYGTTTSYGQAAPCASLPGSGSSPVAVQASVTGLNAHTTYHYRIAVTDAAGTSRGADVEFTSPGPPIVDDELATEVNASAAKLRASVNPSGLTTTYRFEYGTEASYGSTAPAPDGEIGPQQEDADVSQQIIGLQAGSTYHYRVVASNSAGTVYGEDETFTTLSANVPKSTDTCPNAAYRTFASANLPDCRAYELVSPVEKNGADVIGQQINEFVSSVSGERVEFPTHVQMFQSTASGSGGFSEYIATRTPSSWTTKGIMPEVAPGTPFDPSNKVLAFSGELDRAITLGYELPEGSGGVPNTDNLYLEDPLTARITETITRDEGSESINGFFFPWSLRAGGASSDLQVTTFESTYNLTSQTTGRAPKLYVMDHGAMQLAGVLPDGSLPAGGSSRAWKSTIGNEGEDPISIAQSNTVSEDGSRILFASPAEGSTQLYMRKNETETVWVSRSEASNPVSEPVNVRFQAATPDDKHILFTTDTPLLDSDPGGSGTGLYMYTDSTAPETEPNLTFIARVKSLEQNPERQLVVSAVSNDGSYVYFSSGQTESLPESGAGGFFSWHEGNITPMALGINYHTGEFANEGLREAELTPDGKKLVFVSREKFLPGQTILNLYGESKIGMLSHFFANAELYLYDSDAASLKCVSCPPSGDAITNGAEVANVEIIGAPISYQVASPQRYFSSNGKYVFFNTVEALLPQDTNGLTDAYEYNVETGQLSLLSPGTGETPTWFVEASPNGHDVFLLTREKLKRQDVDNLADLYDARIEGGQPEPPPPSGPCAGEACQGTPSAGPSFATASEFVGSGNPRKTATTVSVRKRRTITRSETLKRALKACQRKPKRKRARCDARARRLYAVKQHSKRAGR